MVRQPGDNPALSALPSRAQAERMAQAVVAFYRATRRDLPWRRTTDPYAIWVSEIMLQQTRVATVIPYYERWMASFPTVRALAQAPLDQVLAAWSGLGYYSRARNLHRGARHALEHLGGRLPRSAAELVALPGVGRYTAGAIASIAFGERAALVDGNVARVLARVFAVEGDIKSTANGRALWSLAEALVPADAPGDFNQGLMELGATVCTPTSPSCLSCPLRASCQARQEGREHELPHMPARKRAAELPLIDAQALFIEHRDELVLARRVPSGLYGGLWELPQTEDPARLEALVPGVIVDASRPMHEHSQTLTHRRLRIRVFAARPRATLARPPARLGKPGDERYDKLAWHGRDAIAERGVSAATQRIIQAIANQALPQTDREKNSWNSTRPRSRSSTKGSRRSSRA